MGSTGYGCFSGAASMMGDRLPQTVHSAVFFAACTSSPPQ